MSFRQRLEGLLSGTDTIGNVGLGLLAASGPSTQPVGFGQAAGQALQFASQRQQGAMQTEAMRQEMKARQRQREAAERLPGLIQQLGPQQQQFQVGSLPGGNIVNPEHLGQPTLPGQTPGLLSPEQQQVLSLMGQADPQAAMGLLGQMVMPQEERALPSDIRTMEALGIDLTPEGYQQYLDMQQDNDLAGLAQRVQLMMDEHRLQVMREDADEQRAERERTRIQKTSRFSGGLRDGLEIVQHLDTLENLGRLVPGRPFQRERVFGTQVERLLNEFTGRDAPEADIAAAAAGRMNSLIQRLVLPEAGEMIATLGTATDTKFRAAKQSLLDPESTQQEIRLAVADILETNLQGLDAMGVEFPEDERERVQESIRDLRDLGRIAAPEREERPSRRPVFNPETGEFEQ